MRPETAVGLVRAHNALRLVDPMLRERPFLVVSDFDGTLSRIVLDPWARDHPQLRSGLVLAAHGG